MKKRYLFLAIAAFALLMTSPGRTYALGDSPKASGETFVQLAAASQDDGSHLDVLDRLNETLADYEEKKKDVQELSETLPPDMEQKTKTVQPPAPKQVEEAEPVPRIEKPQAKPVKKTVPRRKRRPKEESKLLKGVHVEKTYREIKSLPQPEPFKQQEDDIQVRDILSPKEIFEVLLTEEARQRKIDLDFDEAPLPNIIMTLGEAGDINIVLDPKLKGNIIDFHLKDATLEEAMILLSNAFDLGFSRVGDSLFVTSKEKIRAENMTSSIVKLKNLNVDEAEQLVKGLIDTVNVSEETNSLVLVGTPDEIIQVEKMLKKMDTPQPQVILEAKIIEMNKDALQDLGVDWSDSIEVSMQEGTRLAEPTNTLNPSREVFEVYKLDRTPLMFDMAIKMLESENKAKVLSNPRITTLNNKEAEIFVGDRIPYAITTVASGVATTEVRYEEPGIRLVVTPSIIEEGFVEIKIVPEVSYIFSFRGPDDQYPWVKKRSATAYVRVKNNQPFIIGGLLNQEDKTNLYKVPFLGDIPLLGNLFKYEKQTAVDNELIIAVTPRVVGMGD